MSGNINWSVDELQFLQAEMERQGLSPSTRLPARVVNGLAHDLNLRFHNGRAVRGRSGIKKKVYAGYVRTPGPVSTHLLYTPEEDQHIIRRMEEITDIWAGTTKAVVIAKELNDLFRNGKKMRTGQGVYSRWSRLVDRILDSPAPKAIEPPAPSMDTKEKEVVHLPSPKGCLSLAESVTKGLKDAAAAIETAQKYFVFMAEEFEANKKLLRELKEVREAIEKFSKRG